MLWTLLACAPEPPPPPAEPAVAAPLPAAPEPAWIEARVADVETRLSSSEAGRVLRESIDATGGLRAWYAASPLAFRFDYQPLNGKVRRYSHQVVDLWRSRAIHTWTDDPRVTFGWDGQTAWQRGPADVELPINPRFWSLTPYYFVGMPFVLADDGVELTLEGPGTFEGRACTLLRVGFTDGTGDAPDDAYVVYVDDETHRVAALRYIVSYPGFFPDGGHSPWKIMAYDGTQTVGSLTLPERFRTFTWSQGPGELVTETRLSDLAVRREMTVDDFAVPADAIRQAEL